MKKPFLAVILCGLLFIGCSTGIKFISKSMTMGIFNFKKYSESGFLFTPHNYLGDYQSIGLMSIMLSPSARLNRIKTNEKGISDSAIYKQVWDIDSIDVEEALDSLHSQAIKLGANAIIDLQIKEISQTYNVNTGQPVVTIFGFKIDGFAIKRLGAFKQDTISN